MYVETEEKGMGTGAAALPVVPLDSAVLSARCGPQFTHQLRERASPMTHTLLVLARGLAKGHTQRIREEQRVVPESAAAAWCVENRSSALATKGALSLIIDICGDAHVACVARSRPVQRDEQFAVVGRIERVSRTIVEGAP